MMTWIALPACDDATWPVSAIAAPTSATVPIAGQQRFRRFIYSALSQKI
jgi:hypothetical protein